MTHPRRELSFATPEDISIRKRSSRQGRFWVRAKSPMHALTTIAMNTFLRVRSIALVARCELSVARAKSRPWK
jgi:hypothetical protein